MNEKQKAIFSESARKWDGTTKITGSVVNVSSENRTRSAALKAGKRDVTTALGYREC